MPGHQTSNRRKLNVAQGLTAAPEKNSAMIPTRPTTKTIICG